MDQRTRKSQNGLQRLRILINVKMISTDLKLNLIHKNNYIYSKWEHPKEYIKKKSVFLVEDVKKKRVH